MSSLPALFEPVRKRRARRSGKTGFKPVLLAEPVEPAVLTLPRLEVIERTGPVLRPSPISSSNEDDVFSLNLTAGCAQRCTFCYARAYPSYPGDDVLRLYKNTAERLEAELKSRRHAPRAVYLCPSTDPFPPFREVQEELCEVVEVLAAHQVESWFMTRGFIRPFALERLARQHEWVRATVSITTLDSRLRRTLEPLAAPPRLRLKQLTELRKLGIAVQAAVDPLVPGITDTRANLEPLLDALALAGVEHITTSYLFLRQGIRDNLLRDLGPLGWAEPILAAYASGPVLPMGNLAPARHLPRARRQRGYALVMALAASRGIRVTVCRLTNPDFGPAPAGDRPLQQLLLQYPG